MKIATCKAAHIAYAMHTPLCSITESCRIVPLKIHIISRLSIIVGLVFKKRRHVHLWLLEPVLDSPCYLILYIRVQ